nr:immunoglobulin kappa light chain-like [Pelodiscus sinensis]|eukprot:XP_025036214.1 immunoglobulin kappa light chain-like [Pelodiscus sinensis]
MSESDIATHVLSWYHQAPGQGPTFLLSHRAGESKPTYGTGVSERFIADLERDTNTFSLTIGNVNPADAGTYYCAVWYANQYLFGEGTRLILGGDTRKKRAPEVALLGPVRVAHPAFLCLAWGFSPEPIRVHWQVDGQDPGSGEASLPVKSQDGTSTVSLLSLPAQTWLAGAQVTCRVEHETQVQQSSSEIKGAGRQGCSVSAGDPLLLPDPFSNGTAGSTAPQSTGAPSLGRILLTAWRCYLGLLAASCFYSLGLSFLMGLQGCRKNQGPQSSVAAPCPQEAQQRVPQRRTGKDRGLE